MSKPTTGKAGDLFRPCPDFWTSDRHNLATCKECRKLNSKPWRPKPPKVKR